MPRHPHDLPKRLRAQFKTTRGALVIDKYGRLRDRRNVTASRWKALKAVNFNEGKLPGLAAALDEAHRYIEEIRRKMGCPLTMEQLDRNVAAREAAGGLVSEEDLRDALTLRGARESMTSYGGCTCSCHRGSGVIHCVPCCRPTLQPESR